MKIIEKFILYLIMIIHYIVICYVLIVPFFGTNYLLTTHAILVPFIVFHWIVNDNTCVLTLMEKYARKNLNIPYDNDSDNYMAKLINPIYDFNMNNKDCSTTIYGITIGLWLISVMKLYCKYKNGTISSFEDLMLK